MKKILGTTRKVFLFKNFVIKLPRILIREGFNKFFSYHYKNLQDIRNFGYKKYRILRQRHKEIFKEYYQEMKNFRKYQIDNTCQKFLFDGLMSNWHEFIFSIRNRKNTFIAHTYFSFFGLINIQKRKEELQIDHEEFKIILEDILRRAGILDNCDYWKDSHTMNNPKNFGRDKNGKLCILDYGNIRMHKFLREYGKLLRDNFII